MENRPQNLPEANSLSITSGQQDSKTKAVIREWLVRFGVNFEKDITAYIPLWEEAFGQMDAGILESLFQKTMQSSKFFPRVADVLEHLGHAKETATGEAAETAWKQVLDIRRTAYNPDLPQYLDRALSRVSERIRRAARAAGVFREHETIEALHVWTKKQFIESFVRWDEAEESQHLLPDGEIKNLLVGAAETKALPAPSLDFHALHERGLEYAARVKQSTPELSPEARLIAADRLAEAAKLVIAEADANRRTITVSDGDREAFRKQAERIKALYPESKTTDPRLLQFVSEKP